MFVPDIIFSYKFPFRSYLAAMKEVVVPVTMTSIVNVSMFAILVSVRH